MTLSKTTHLPVLGFLTLLGMPYAAALAGEADPGTTLAAEFVPPSRNEAVTQALSDKDALEQVIRQLETTQGAYGAELSEAYFQLGTTERALENYEEAVQAFGQALQILRTGYGLLDLRQLPILEELLATSQTLEDWQEVDSLHHLMHFITSRNPETETEVRFQSLVQLGRWKVQAEVDGLLPEKADSVKEALQLYDNEIGKLEASATYQGRNIHLATLYLDLAAVEFTQAKAKYAMPITEFGMGGQSSISTVNCIAFTGRDGRTVQSCTSVEVPNPSYYMEPSNKKNMQIRQHLDEMKNDVLEAYRTLQNEPEGTNQRAALLAEVQRLTREYNDFATMNSKSSMYRLD